MLALPQQAAIRRREKNATMRVEHVVFWTSVLGLLILAVLNYLRSKNLKQFLFEFLFIAVSGGIYLTVFQTAPPVQSKGVDSSGTAFVIILYICMLIGMAFHSLYVRLMKPATTRQPFDLGTFIAPVFASPIVFIPLLGAFQNADVDLANLTLPKYMVFLVAFENGFFWKELVDNRIKARKS
jgi:hypothetical protein